ncbi:MAG: ACT domain-containing protein [Verrucomicrobiota bacterium]
MISSIVITLIGPDRSGLVEEIARTVASGGGNWLESRLSHLGGQFAGMVQIEVAEDKVAELKSALEGLASHGLEVVVCDATTADMEDCDQVALVEIVGHDRSGIVSQISSAFAAFKVNVERLDTERKSAPMTGEALFEAKARVCIPSEVDLGNLSDKLEEIASDLMVDVTVEVEK